MSYARHWVLLIGEQGLKRSVENCAISEGSSMEMVPETVIRLTVPAGFGLWMYPAGRVGHCGGVFSETFDMSYRMSWHS